MVDHVDPIEAEGEESSTEATQVTDPIIVELGRQRPRDIDRLKEGRGELWYEVIDVLEEINEQLGEQAQGKLLVPIILVYEERRRGFDPLFPF